MREYQLAEREFDQALARGEKDGIMAAVANMAEALKALSMDPWSGFDDGTAAQFAAPQAEEEQPEMDLSSRDGD